MFSSLVPGCDNLALVGDGLCNDETNNADCNFDGGDCCVENANKNSCSTCECHVLETCAAGYHPLVGNGFCDNETTIAECEYDRGDCCSNPELASNGVCNDGMNIPECNYDGGDCCLNPNMVGDGICNDETNHLGCIYDGGDCCLMVRISLTNELLVAGYEYFNGDYVKSLMPNGQTRWINSYYAIWYYYSPSYIGTTWYYFGYWVIGSVSDIGTNQASLYASDDFNGLSDDKNEWSFWDGSNYISSTDPSDIQITCLNYN